LIIKVVIRPEIMQVPIQIAYIMLLG
jgi:hypothetical protein